MCRIYSTDKVDSSGYPQYADCVTFNLGGSMYRFGFENYSWYWTYVNPNNTTYSAGTGISLSGTTFSNSGVRSITTGSTNGTISVNTNGTTTNVTVKGLAAGAYASTYAGSSSAGGSATSAVQLATARTIQTNLGSTSAASFNGTANVTPGVTGILPIANGGTGANTAAAAKSKLGLGNVDNTADSAKSVKYATTAGSAPASDVYSWAKQSTKPTYTASEVGALPLSGGTASGNIVVTDGTYTTTLAADSVSCSFSGGGWTLSRSGISLSAGSISTSGNITCGSGAAITGQLTCSMLKVSSSSAIVSGYNVLHKGNSAPVAIQESAPSDTSALWVY